MSSSFSSSSDARTVHRFPQSVTGAIRCGDERAHEDVPRRRLGAVRVRVGRSDSLCGAKDRSRASQSVRVDLTLERGELFVFLSLRVGEHLVPDASELGVELR
jgi:hypothetical protein